MFAVVVRTGVVVVVFERHVLCAFGGQVSEARVECTFLANDAAYLTLPRAVTQLRRSEIVTPGVGLAVCVVCGVFKMKSGLRQNDSPCNLRASASCACAIDRAFVTHRGSSVMRAVDWHGPVRERETNPR